LADPDIPAQAKIRRMRASAQAVVRRDRRELADSAREIREEYFHARGKRCLRRDGGEFAGKDTPVFIISRDRVAALKDLVAWLEHSGHTRLVVVDNGSTYPPLRDYLAEITHQVIPLDRNAGHTSAWDSGAIGLLAPHRYYVVTDPDIVPTADCPDDAVFHLHRTLTEFPAFEKAGLGLVLDDLPDHYALKDSVISWERKYWEREIGHGVFEGGVDTTFALYRPDRGYFIHPSLRTGPPYVARHLAWYTDGAHLTDEDAYYRAHAADSINSWDNDKLEQRYARVMKK
jgi:hypothetical protein